MTQLESIPPLSGENPISDDDDVVLLTDEILPSEDDDIIELSESVDFADTQKVMKLPDTAKDKTGFFGLSDVIEETDLNTERLPDFSEKEAGTLNLDFDRITDHFRLEPKIQTEDAIHLDVLHMNASEEIKEIESYRESDESKAPVTEYQMDDLQRLIDEVVHDSQVPHQDLPGIHSDLSISTEKDVATYQDMMAFQPKDQIEAAMDRVIRNLFAEKIAHILDEVVTTTVTREIENLKTIILNYLATGKPVDKTKS